MRSFGGVLALAGPLATQFLTGFWLTAGRLILLFRGTLGLGVGLHHNLLPVEETLSGFDSLLSTPPFFEGGEPVVLVLLVSVLDHVAGLDFTEDAQSLAESPFRVVSPDLEEGDTSLSLGIDSFLKAVALEVLLHQEFLSVGTGDTALLQQEVEESLVAGDDNGSFFVVETLPFDEGFDA